MQNTNTVSKPDARFSPKKGVIRRANRSRSNSGNCPAFDLTFYKLAGQSVRYSDHRLARLEKQTQRANLEFAVAPIKDSMPLIKALSKSGFILDSQLNQLRNALSTNNHVELLRWLPDTLSVATKSISDSLRNDIWGVLKALPNAESIIPDLERYSLYRLEVSSQCSDGTGIFVGYSCVDYFQHHEANVDLVRGENRNAYASLLNLLLNKGDGIWQTEATHCAMYTLRPINSDQELSEIKTWYESFQKADSEEKKALASKEQPSSAVNDFLADLAEREFREVEEINFDDESDYETLVDNIEESINWFEACWTLEVMTNSSKSFNDISQLDSLDGTLGETIKSIATIAATLTNDNSDVFEAVEETWGGCGLILKPFKDANTFQCTLNHLSDSVYQDHMNCGESDDAWTVEIISQHDWYQVLLQRMLATALMMYLIEAAQSDLLPD